MCENESATPRVKANAYSPGQRHAVEVTDHKTHGPVPAPGSVGIAKVTQVMAKTAFAGIMCIGQKFVCEKYTCIIRHKDVMATEIDKVYMHLSFRSGDIVEALVLSLGDARTYFLTTAKNELGVVSAESTAGATMVPITEHHHRAAISSPPFPPRCFEYRIPGPKSNVSANATTTRSGMLISANTTLPEFSLLESEGFVARNEEHALAVDDDRGLVESRSPVDLESLRVRPQYAYVTGAKCRVAIQLLLIQVVLEVYSMFRSHLSAKTLPLLFNALHSVSLHAHNTNLQTMLQHIVADGDGKTCKTKTPSINITGSQKLQILQKSCDNSYPNTSKNFLPRLRNFNQTNID
ncbi:hypothetical protein KIW84_062795 [Lathyrus oleraceus]|uniref:Exosome complex component CSL4 C-terminal domain-containing protein n=1 Tax=Pisum sativum TaxID=3888 RepID=A0A9D4W6S7_PEA|nr:hypothetical protein KIW84_062795 [Pisum sativum]